MLCCNCYWSACHLLSLIGWQKLLLNGEYEYQDKAIVILSIVMYIHQFNSQGRISL